MASVGGEAKNNESKNSSVINGSTGCKTERNNSSQKKRSGSLVGHHQYSTENE